MPIEYVKQILTGVPVAEEGLLRYIQREVFPVVRDVRDRVNRLISEAVPVLEAECTLTVVSLTGAANTLALEHAGSYLRVSHSAATTLTVPANSVVAFEIGTVIPMIQAGAGQVTISPAGGVAINRPSLLSLVSAERYSQFYIVKVATDEWDCIGDLELA